MPSNGLSAGDVERLQGILDDRRAHASTPDAPRDTVSDAAIDDARHAVALACRDGRNFVRARDLVDCVPHSSVEMGQALAALEDDEETVTKWSGGTRAYWRIER